MIRAHFSFALLSPICLHLSEVRRTGIGPNSRMIWSKVCLKVLPYFLRIGSKREKGKKKN